MRAEFFQSQMERLRRVYSPASLNEERVKVLWDRFNNTEGPRFEQAISHLIGEFTTQALPSLTRFSEAIMMFRGSNGGSNAHMQEMLPAHFCDPCRDFGFGFVGDTLVACSCENGRQLSPAELARQQGAYDRGRAFLARGQKRTAFLQPLPYDPTERSGA